LIDAGLGTTRAEHAQETHTQSHISPSLLVYEEKNVDIPVAGLLEHLPAQVSVWAVRAPTGSRVCVAHSRCSHSSPLCTSIPLGTVDWKSVGWVAGLHGVDVAFVGLLQYAPNRWPTLSAEDMHPESYRGIWYRGV